MHNFSHRCHYSMLLSGFLKKKLLWVWKAKVLQQLRIIKIGHFIKKVTYGPGLLKGSFTRMMLLCLQNYKIIISLINILFHKDFRFLKFENFCSKHASKRVGWIDLKKSLKCNYYYPFNIHIKNIIYFQIFNSFWESLMINSKTTVCRKSLFQDKSSPHNSKEIVIIPEKFLLNFLLFQLKIFNSMESYLCPMCKRITLT